MSSSATESLEVSTAARAHGNDASPPNTKGSEPDPKTLDKPPVNASYLLPIIWYTSPSGIETVNTIVTPFWIYAGSNGVVYRLSKRTARY